MSRDYSRVGSILWPVNFSGMTCFSGGLTVRCLILMDDAKHGHNHHLGLRTSQ